MNDTADRVLEITRVFDAPRALVFKAWSSPEHLARWWGPTGFTVTLCEVDFRVGGAWRVRMKSPAGVEDRQLGEFREIVEPERIVFTYAFEDFAGRETSGRWSDDSGLPGHQTIVTVNFEDLGARTRLTVRQAVFESINDRNEHVRGWGEAMDRFAAYIAEV